MSIYSQISINKKSNLTQKGLQPFENKVKIAISKSLLEGNDESDLFCDIVVDGHIPQHIEQQLTKIRKNLLVGFSEGSNLSSANWRAFIFECMAIKDKYIEDASQILIIVSRNNFLTKDSKNIDKDMNQENEEDLTVSFEAIVPKYSLDKVILDEITKAQLSRSIALIRNQKLIFDTWGFREVDPNTKTILCFFGAPGTGKTMCAHAIAKELGKKIMVASYASIESKWVGEGPKNMRRIFKDAEEQDALLFFDEADSFLSKRVNNAETGSDKHYNRMSNEMFQLLEEYDGVVVFATNLVSDFDKAFKSRILSFVEFTLPDDETRVKLIETMIPSKLPLNEPLSANIIQPLANCSEGFSGREIRKALLISLSEAALKEKTCLGLKDLLIGFESVKQEREAIDETASKQRGIIADFLEVDEQNRSIVEICQWALNQKEGYTDSSKEVFYKICKVLNIEMPDLTISYKNKDIKNSADIVSTSGRIEETLIYVVQLLVSGGMLKIEADKIIKILANTLGYDNVTYIYEYYTSLKNLTSQ